MKKAKELGLTIEEVKKIIDLLTKIKSWRKILMVVNLG
jgi:DNA-binding transcriptional MerR regulator